MRGGRHGPLKKGLPGAGLIGQRVAGLFNAGVPMDRMLKLFAYGHLEREDLLAISRRFHDLAHQLVEIVPEGPERTVSLRKLLEAKDAAVRAVAIPETA